MVNSIAFISFWLILACTALSVYEFYHIWTIKSIDIFIPSSTVKTQLVASLKQETNDSTAPSMDILNMSSFLSTDTDYNVAVLNSSNTFLYSTTKNIFKIPILIFTCICTTIFLYKVVTFSIRLPKQPKPVIKRSIFQPQLKALVYSIINFLFQLQLKTLIYSIINFLKTYGSIIAGIVVMLLFYLYPINLKHTVGKDVDWKVNLDLKFWLLTVHNIIRNMGSNSFNVDYINIYDLVPKGRILQSKITSGHWSYNELDYSMKLLAAFLNIEDKDKNKMIHFYKFSIYTEIEKSLKILGLNYPTTFKEIKQKYRILASQSHPDKNKDDKATETTVKINEAYSSLKIFKLIEDFEKSKHKSAN